MQSVYVLLVLGICGILPWSQARPRDKNHRGLYDDVKITPFVDEKIEDTDVELGQNWKNLGNDDESFNKYNKIYDLYHQQTGRTVAENKKEGETGDNTTVDSKDSDSVDTSRLPVEGGTEAEGNDRRKSDGDDRKKHRHGKSRAYRVHPKKHTLHSEDLSKEDKSMNTRKEYNNELNSDNLPDEREDLFKFLDEDPKFKKNVGVITDWKVRDTSTDSVPIDDSNNDDQSNESKDIGENSNDKDFDKTYGNKAEDDSYDKDTVEQDDDYDSTDDDDKTVGDEDETKDLSSEMYADAYEYYDGEEESSYSSSEMRANKDYYNTETPYDWFKQYEKVYGKKYTSKTSETDVKQGPKDFDKYDYVNDEPVTDFLEEKVRNLVDDEESDSADTTDSTLEPSTSPNPPTEKKEWKPMVTQPAHSDKKKNPEYVTYIESRPVEACDVDWDCPPGRYCKFGLCICGQPNFCAGHDKPVCGSDGTLYPSHCELHRTACVKGVHIRLVEMKSCKDSVEDEDPVDSESAVEDKVPVPRQDTEQHTSVESEPEETQETDETDSTEFDETVNDTEEKIDKKIEIPVKDDGLSLVAASAVKQAVDINIARKLKNEDKKDERVKLDYEFDSDAKSAEYEIDYSDSLEEESEESTEESFEDTEESQDHDVSETNESEERKGKKFVERTESAEKLSLTHDSEESIDDEEETDSTGGESKEESKSKEEESDSKEEESVSKEEEPSLVPLYCTPELYLEFKANVLQYHCLFFEEPNCDKQTQQDKHKLAAVMFNYFDHNYNGRVEKVELWKMQLRENMDEISTLCTLLDIVTFDELGVRDEELSPDEFIQAFDIPDLLEHRLEIVPLLVTIGNGLEVKCDVTMSHEVIWRRNGMDLALLNFPGISVLGDGSLYIESVGADLVGNITCHDRNKPSVKQVHMLTVQRPPHVTISPKSSDHEDHSDVELRCQAEGLPRPVVEWRFNDQTVEQGEKYYIHTYDNSLTVIDVDYLEDSGVYTCVAHNNAGTSKASATIIIRNPNDTDIQEFASSEESFIVFHDDGYSMHEPSKCLSQRHVKPDFGNFYFIPDELDEAPSMCQKGIPCIWGTSVNVLNRFVFVTQPRQNRVLVIDVKDTLNPNQVIPTDRMPVSLYYLSHLDEVWVLCWNGEEDGGGKTMLVIRDASKKIQHHTIHTQPIGNRFDMVQDIFLPPATELHAPYRYGYTVHNGQQGLFKLDLVEKKYLKAIDFTMYQCVPKAVAFVPLGGMVMVKCVTSSSSGDNEILLQMDYVTDVVISNTTVYGTPYVTPDSRNVVIVDEHSGQIKVFTVTPHGEVTDEFDLTVGSPVNSVTFIKASYSQGYDLYMTSVEAQALYSVSLLNGKIDIIKGVGAADSDLFLPWFQTKRPLVSGDVFSQFLSTTAMSRMVIFNAKHRSIQCDFININNPLVIEYARLYN